MENGLRLIHVGDDQPDQVELFYRELIASIAAAQNEPLVIDLSSIDFITADMLLRLITAARLWHRMTGHRTTLDGMQLNVHQYLERMNLFTACEDCIRPAHHLAPVDCWSRSPASHKLLEVMPLSAEALQNSQDVARAVGRAQRILNTWFGADPAVNGPIATILSEIASNVTHSCDRGFAHIQHHSRQTGGSLTIAVGDLGIGIEASLQKQGARLLLAEGEPVPTGADAILRALELGVTGRGEVGGVGLHRVKAIVEEWQGKLLIRSRQSRVQIVAGEARARDGLVAVPGTQVIITVRR